MMPVTDGYLHKSDYLEKNGLLPNNASSMHIGSGLLYLPAARHAGKEVKLMDMWGFNEAQETSEVSPRWSGNL